MNRLQPRLSNAPPRFISFFQEFIRLEAASGILLIACTIAALVWANSPWRASYNSLWQTNMAFEIADFRLSKPLLIWVNDGLMAIFFFVVGLEIKREVLMGELRSLRQASLPVAAALGGMIIPAVLYALLNWGQASLRGWGIPMATDIAFTLGVLALLGTRAPLSLKILLTALAIVDDLGAVLVIAIFYSHGLNLTALAVGALCLVALIFVNRMAVRQRFPYVLLGIILWVAFVQSGIHATIAGVLLAMTIPARLRAERIDFVQRTQEAFDNLAEHHADPSEVKFIEEEALIAAQVLEDATEAIESPLHEFEHALHPWVSYLILPVFALANAGIELHLDAISTAFSSPISLGILAGLAIGKPLGVTLLSWLALRLRIAQLPNGLSFRTLFGGSLLTGIGFTMSIFIASLAFEQPENLAIAKIGIIAASLVSGIAGWLFLLMQSASASEDGDAEV